MGRKFTNTAVKVQIGVRTHNECEHIVGEDDVEDDYDGNDQDKSDDYDNDDDDDVGDFNVNRMFDVNCRGYNNSFNCKNSTSH